ncbi:embryogenesis-like protein [Andrographis paniculata]|uniref:embryogenesis-like protein n=1 Tax=Andrographis paniculata TaxID=175694 RepID=UPI0021E71E42|nr:embryogenesis-like protein [Andrographis paniculata]
MESSRRMLSRTSIPLRKLLSEFHFGRSAVTESPVLSRSFTKFSTRRCWVESSRFSRPTIAISPNYFEFLRDCRSYSVDADKEVDRINLKFAEAREEIESAMESRETVYFNEEADCARAAVGEVLGMYEDLLKKLPETDKGKIQRAMGLKIEQLKAELEQLNE